MKYLKLGLLFVCFFTLQELKSQGNAIDSLIQLAARSSDSLKTQLYLDIANAYRGLKTDSALIFTNKAFSIAEKNGNYHNLADTYIMSGAIYRIIGNYDQSIYNLLQALKYYELIGDKKGIANTSNSLGILYYNQEDYQKALKYYNSALELVDSTYYPSSKATYMLNISEVDALLGNLKKAENEVRKSLLIFDSIEDVEGKAYCYGVLAKIKFDQHEYEDAIENSKSSLELFMDAQDYVGAIEYLLLLGNIYAETDRLDLAIQNTRTALTLSKQIHSASWKQRAYDQLSSLLFQSGSFKAAYQFKDSSFLLKDTLINEDKQRQIANLRIAYETEQKEKENEMLRQNRILNERKIRQQTIINTAIGIILVLIIVVLFLTVRAYRLKQRSNNKLRRYNEEIYQQREEIESQADSLKAINEKLISQSEELSSKNKNITDSINYAKRIQTAILPFTERIKNSLADHFILYKPKDIVSGDFYWFKEIDQKVYIVVADCTGHGIPGAFMSFIGHESLNYLINLKSMQRPDEILRHLKDNVIHLLRQKENDNRDGMDIGLCVWDKKENSVQFAGANIDLLYVVDNELHEIKGNKVSISFDELKRNRSFDLHEVKIEKDSCFYMSTDGFTDQFGGPEGKKFMKRRFKNLLVENHLNKMSTQKERLESAFENWKKEEEQVDDLLIFGFRIYEL